MSNDRQLAPKMVDIGTPEIPDGEFVIRANGTWLELADNEKPFVLTDTQHIVLYYVPLEPVAAALDCTLSKNGSTYKIAYGDFVTVAGTVYKDGVAFVSTEYLTNAFAHIGVDVTVKKAKTVSADTLSSHGEMNIGGQILISLRTERPLVLAGEVQDYAFEPGEHTFDDVSFTYRKTRAILNSEAKTAFIVFLHGGSGRGRDNGKHLDKVRTTLLDWFTSRGMNAELVLPQAVEGSWSYYRYALVDFIEQELAENADLDPDRVYMMGVSAGAGGVWQVLDVAPNLFAGALAAAYYAETEEKHIFNAVPYEPQYLISLENVAKVPLMLVSGDRDINGIATRPANVEASYNDVLAAGGEACFDLMPGLDHFGVCVRAIEDQGHLDWVFSHVRPEA